MADVEGNGRTMLAVPEELVEANAVDSTETRLAVPEKLAEADAEGKDDPRIFVLQIPVGEDSVMYATDEAFMTVAT